MVDVRIFSVQNQRRPKLLTLTVRLEGDKRPASYARSIPLPRSYDKQRLVTLCKSIITKENAAKMPNNRCPVVTNLGVSASNFISQNSSANSKIDRFFSRPMTEENFSEDVQEKTQLIDEEDVQVSEDNSAISPFQIFEENSAISSVGMSEENSFNSFVEAEGNQIATANFTGILDDQRSDEKSSGITEEPNSKKKLGFFASRNVKKIESKTPELKADNKEQFPSFCVHEIFPDLDHVDSETLTLLPLEIQRKVRQEIEWKKGSKGQGGDFVDCDTCGQTLLREEVAEHRDYHLAMELQKEMSLEASTSSAVPNPAVKVAASKSTKRPHKESKAKGNAKSSKRSRTIESFFTKTQ